MPTAQKVICGLMGVSKGNAIHAIHTQGVCTLAQLKEKPTRASTGCGSCTAPRQQRPKSVVPEFEVRSQNRTLANAFHFQSMPFGRSYGASSFALSVKVLELTTGMGCVFCKLSLSYLLDVVWCGDLQGLAARFINDRVHAKHPTGWHIFCGSAHAGRCYLCGKNCAGLPTSRGQIQRADGEDHLQSTHRPAGNQEV